MAAVRGGGGRRHLRTKNDIDGMHTDNKKRRNLVKFGGRCKGAGGLTHIGRTTRQRKGKDKPQSVPGEVDGPLKRK